VKHEALKRSQGFDRGITMHILVPWLSGCEKRKC